MDETIQAIQDAIKVMEERRSIVCLHVLGQGLHETDCDTAIRELNKILAVLKSEEENL